MLFRGATATVTRAMVVNGAQLGTYAQVNLNQYIVNILCVLKSVVAQEHKGHGFDVHSRK